MVFLIIFRLLLSIFKALTQQIGAAKTTLAHDLAGWLLVALKDLMGSCLLSVQLVLYNFWTQSGLGVMSNELLKLNKLVNRQQLALRTTGSGRHGQKTF